MTGVKRMRYRDRRRRTVILSVLALVGFMSIGYALLATNLRITGTSNISSNFNVYIKSIKAKTLHNATTIEASVGSNKLTANFEVGLEAPGSYAEYEVVVANDSSFNIELKTIGGIYEANQKAPTTIQFSTDQITQGEVLDAGEEKTFIVRVDFDIDATSLPTQNKQLTLTLDYEQSDGSGETYPKDLGFSMTTSSAKLATQGNKISVSTVSGDSGAQIIGKLSSGVFRAGSSYRIDVKVVSSNIKFLTSMGGTAAIRTGAGQYDYTELPGSWVSSGNTYSFAFTMPSSGTLVNNTGEFLFGIGGAYFQWSGLPSAPYIIAEVTVTQLS